VCALLTESHMNHNNEAATADVKQSFAEKVARGIFRPVARHLREDLVEDRLAEGIGMAFEQYVSRAARGEVMNDAVLVMACHMRAIDMGRRLAGAYGAQPKRDVLDERNYKDGTVEVLRLDGLLEDEDDEGAALGIADADVRNPVRRLVSALDLERWLSSLASEDRLLLALRQAGHTLEEIAEVTGRGITTVCHRLRELGQELAERAGIELHLERAA
jgi:DNA-directed RNA polymerase specialized sigma24 family protein